MTAAATPDLLDALVVGAGISGLSTAQGLRRAGLRVQVLEAEPRAGGVITSVARGGALYERGPNSALDTTPLIGEMVEALGLQGQMRFASEAAAKRYVVRGGALHALPMSPGAFLRTPLFSAGAKLGLLREPFVARGDPAREETIAAFVRRRLGPEFLDYAIDPFVAGIYAGDPEQISVQAAFPKLQALEQRWGSLIRGQILGGAERRRAKETAKNTAKSFSFAGGMQVLTDALAATVGPLALETRVTRIARGGDGVFTVDAQRAGEALRWRTRALVLATPADVTATLLREHAADAAAALQEIAYAPVATVASVYARADVAHPLDGFGCLVPRREGRRVLGVLFSSSMFEGRAAAGEVLLTSFIGGRRQPELPALDEAAIADIAWVEHQALLGAGAAPRWQVVTRWPRAIPQYTLGHLGRVARATAAAQALPGLFFVANWKGGVAVGDCIRNGQEGARAVAEWLGGTAR
ncbi:Protoporphyrinogen oxidase [Rubrivivax sp. A210]|uniref:protoporphyrinogen oxidase n=1 Tax=Rubrivivax sp. A210 TaxID=2772301 RepID=UPI0019199936|nr:protoporphyrinogen oxidase [Rubrivivax sp. A210]CAD5375003.1 Protoporphyrinogen oxidase [Rubrivivax sp. A210]